MSSFKYKDIDINYEVYGTGKPIIILNGIMMSTKSWEIFIDAFSKNNQLILLDFIDQGQSGDATFPYTQFDQASIIKKVIDLLELQDISIVGISYGGEVAIIFSTMYPHFAKKLVLANTTSKTSNWLKDIGRGWNEISTKENSGHAYYLGTIPIIYSPEFYNNNTEWMKNRENLLKEHFNNQTVKDRLTRLVNSAEDYDCESQLHKIKSKTLIIGATCDYLTPLFEQEKLNKNIENSELVIFPNTGHASMYEKPELFASTILGFINLDEKITL